jgi:poly(A) polymerase
MVDTGLADVVLPELPALRMAADEHGQHKDVYAHTLQVLDQAIELEDGAPDLVLRWAALLHDVGKPATRAFLPGGRVTFHHHEVVGARLARKRLKALKCSKDLIEDVGQLVFLHLRFYGYRSSDWTDSAVRRYVVDAGPLLPRLHKLVRSDCTTRNKRKAAALSSAYDTLESRIAELEKQEELEAIRPDLDGNEIMTLLDIPPGRLVGAAYKYLLALRMEHGPLGHDRAVEELRTWFGQQG